MVFVLWSSSTWGWPCEWSEAWSGGGGVDSWQGCGCCRCESELLRADKSLSRWEEEAKEWQAARRQRHRKFFKKNPQKLKEAHKQTYRMLLCMCVTAHAGWQSTAGGSRGGRSPRSILGQLGGCVARLQTVLSVTGGLWALGFLIPKKQSCV